MLKKIFFFFENHALYEIMWKNVVERGTPQMEIWRMRIACWESNATNTHSQYVILILLFHYNNGYTNAPRYVIRTLSVCLSCCMLFNFS